MQVKKQQLESDREQRTCSKLGKEYIKAVYCCIHCLFNFYAEYIMWNAGLDESQTGIKIAGKNIINLRYADDTTLVAESEEELKNHLMRVKEDSEKADLKLNIQKNKDHGTFTENRRGEIGNRDRFSFLGLQNHCG